ncbi:hypothetical protein COB57_00890 [Candidatus Peregrinibacteria bacterium]|nr:MAG: hypothetical protein COB57_00890 [Candidatus Peregrinibacteria bacterium]
MSINNLQVSESSVLEKPNKTPFSFVKNRIRGMILPVIFSGVMVMNTHAIDKAEDERGGKKYEASVLQGKSADEMIDIVRDNKVLLLSLAQSESLSFLTLENLSDDMRSDKEVVLAFVNQDGINIQFASKELQEDKDVVFAAVGQNGVALEFVSMKYKNDLSLVRIATRLFANNLRFAAHRFRDNEKFVRRLLRARKNGTLEMASDRLKDLKRFVSFMMSLDINNLKFASPRWQKDEGLRKRAKWL